MPLFLPNPLMWFQSHRIAKVCAVPTSWNVFVYLQRKFLTQSTDKVRVRVLSLSLVLSCEPLIVPGWQRSKPDNVMWNGEEREKVCGHDHLGPATWQGLGGGREGRWVWGWNGAANEERGGERDKWWWWWKWERKEIVKEKDTKMISFSGFRGISLREGINQAGDRWERKWMGADDRWEELLDWRQKTLK